MIISRKFGKNIWTLDGVMEYFNDELSAQENCSSPPNEPDKHRKAGYYTTSGLFSQASKVHVHIVIRKGISTLNVLLSLVQSHVRLFFVEITGVLFVLTRVT
jgi:hypothetical protein